MSISKQSHYKYSAENFGYSNIEKLYNPDSVNVKTTFFNSESLQYLEMTLQSDLEKSILKKTKDSMLICYQLQNLKLDLKNEGISIDLHPILKELIKPVFVYTDVHGKIGAIKFDAGVSQIARGLYKDILSRMQFVKPLKQSKDWKTTEENTLGTYIAEYQNVDSDSSNRLYKKNVLDYLTYKSKNENQKIKTDNNSTIETDASGTIKKINISEAQIIVRNNDTLSILGSKVSVCMSSEKQVKSVDIAHLLVLENSKNYRQKTTLSEALSHEKIKGTAYKGTLGSDNWETLIQKLSKTENLTNALKEDLILKFRALFYLQPEYCSKAVSFLDNQLATSNEFVLLSKALSITETPGATNALAILIDKRKSNEELMGALIPVLTTTKYPTSKAIEVLKKIGFSESKTLGYFTKSIAQLALGGMAKNLEHSDTFKSETLTNYLIEKMTLEKDPLQYLFVLGNTGSPLVFPYVKSLLENKHSSEEIKLEAVSALSLIDDEKVSSYLKQLMQNKNVALKNKAKEVLEFQGNN
ncbi:hypothetical protein [Maribacter luteus]|uniref:Vitellogenin domain-containing protein n=1 Tax=Maribacter luteus TaxID=2594478 RepID=A0A6I2MVC1_9FLAO|nr:hypothetical protein [Maribacter luteus]MRX65546.1 hypothetical protein [Maribacter luteus]